MEEDILTRLRLRHTGPNNTLHVLRRHATGNCDYCGELEHLEYVLILCRQYQTWRDILRNTFDQEKSLMFSMYFSKIQGMFCFLRKTGLYYRM